MRDAAPSTAHGTAGTTNGERMLNSDAFAWYMEQDPVLRSTVVAVIRLASSPDWDRLRFRIDRLSRLMPRLRMRVQAPWLRIGPPRWTVDEHFDLDVHLRRVRVPDGGGWDDVLEFARTAAMTAFDRTRPLWEFTLVEDLADGSAALVTKIHHSLTDGIGGVQLAKLVVDPAPDWPQPDALPEGPHGHRLSSVALSAQVLADNAADAIGVTVRTVRALPAMVMRSVLHPAGELHDGVNITTSVARFVAPINHQDSTLMGPRDTTRVLATLDVPFAELHEAAQAAGCHVNDAYLAALVEGMRRYHHRRGSILTSMRITVPISLRAKDDAIGGNRITLVRLRVSAAIDDTTERIRHMASVMNRWRHEPALDHAQEIAAGLNLLPRAYLGGVLKRVEMLASDVPGIPQPVWVAGARATGYYGFGPTIGAGVNATLMSYAGVCNVGINIDTSAVPDAPVLLECLREGFDDVLGLAVRR